MKPICTKCQRFYRPKKNGYPFIEGMPIGTGIAPGTADPEHWEDYKLWMGDLWICKGCGHELIVGCGHQPIKIQHEDEFEETVQAYVKIDNDGKPLLRINDC